MKFMSLLYPSLSRIYSSIHGKPEHGRSFLFVNLINKVDTRQEGNGPTDSWAVLYISDCILNFSQVCTEAFPTLRG